MSLVEQRFRKMGSDEAGPAGDQRAHAVSFRYDATVRGSARTRRRPPRCRSRRSRSAPGAAAATVPHRTPGRRRDSRPGRSRPAPAAAESAPGNGSVFRCRALRGALAIRHAPGCGRRTDGTRDRDPVPPARRRTHRGAPRDTSSRARRRRSVQPRQQRQPRAEDRRLDFVEPRVDARLLMMIAIRLAAVAQTLDSSRERAIASHDRAAVAERAEVLRRIETERARDADRADRAAGRRSPDVPGSSPRRSPGCAATRSARSRPCLPAGRRDEPA